jgi:hypothetical protein
VAKSICLDRRIRSDRDMRICVPNPIAVIVLYYSPSFVCSRVHPATTQSVKKSSPESVSQLALLPVGLYQLHVHALQTSHILDDELSGEMDFI